MHLTQEAEEIIAAGDSAAGTSSSRPYVSVMGPWDDGGVWNPDPAKAAIRRRSRHGAVTSREVTIATTSGILRHSG